MTDESLLTGRDERCLQDRAAINQSAFPGWTAFWLKVADHPWPAAIRDTLERLPALVRAARLKRGLSYRDAARQMDYNYADLWRFEHGVQQPMLGTVLEMLRWLEDKET